MVEKWWLWTIVGVVAAGGATAGFLLTRAAPTDGDVFLSFRQGAASDSQ